MAYYNFKTQGSSAKAYYLGELTSGSSMNVASKYDDYANLTSDNFVVVPQTKSASSTKTNTNYVDWGGWTEKRSDTNTATYTQPSVSYNASTGALTFTSTVACGGSSYGSDNSNPSAGKWCYTYPSATQNLTAKVYLLPEIESL